MDLTQNPKEVAQYKKDIVGCRENDSPLMASFISPSLGLRATLLKSLERLDPSMPGGVTRVPGSGFSIQFKAGEYHTWSKTQIRLIMESSFYKAGKIIPNPEDPNPKDPNGMGYWENQGVLKFKKVEVIDRMAQGYVGLEDIDLDKVPASVKLKDGEKAKPKTPRMFVG